MSRPNVPPGGGQSFAFPVHLPGPFSADVANAARFAMPGRYMVVSASGIARASSGDGQSCKVDVKADGVSLLATPLPITAAAATEATMLNLSSSGGAVRPTIQAGGVLSFDVDVGGTTPEYKDVSLVLELVKK